MPGKRAGETAGEREQRRLARRAAKAELERQANSISGYTNDSNPFHDPNLTTPVVWPKRNEAARAVVDETPEERKRRVAEEVDKTKARRAERAAEKALMEEERARAAREAELDNIDEWDAKEEAFHLEQAKERSRKRMADGRAKPIDFLARPLDTPADDVIRLSPVEAMPPYRLVENMAPHDLDDLRDDLHERLHLADGNEKFGTAMLDIVEDERSRLQQDEADEAERTKQGAVALGDAEELRRHQPASARAGGIQETVLDDVDEIFGGKSLDELATLDTQIRATIAGAGTGAAVDVEYWEALLARLQVFKARAVVTDVHKRAIDARLAHLRTLYPDEDEDAVAARLLTGKDEDEDEDAEAAAGGDDGDATTAEKTWAEKQAASKMEDNEEAFNVEAEINAKYRWDDKYRPRKPKYFNRVLAGYEWNSYNRTHYDSDNPPPRVIQGYKFNIFYPDLIDKSVAPSYFKEPGPAPDIVRLRFTAGAPYEDIAFHIPNRDWEFARRWGFKSSFDRGVLQLHFRFKRFRYRK